MAATRLQSTLRRARLQASFLDQVGLPRELPTRLTMVILRGPNTGPRCRDTSSSGARSASASKNPHSKRR
jgi:hypothetical protein